MEGAEDGNVGQQLERLSRLHRAGQLSDAEFTEAKRKLLAEVPAKNPPADTARFSRQIIYLGMGLLTLALLLVVIVQQVSNDDDSPGPAEAPEKVVAEATIDAQKRYTQALTEAHAVCGPVPPQPTYTLTDTDLEEYERWSQSMEDWTACNLVPLTDERVEALEQSLEDEREAIVARLCSGGTTAVRITVEMGESSGDSMTKEWPCSE